MARPVPAAPVVWLYEGNVRVRCPYCDETPLRKHSKERHVWGSRRYTDGFEMDSARKTIMAKLKAARGSEGEVAVSRTRHEYFSITFWTGSDRWGKGEIGFCNFSYNRSDSNRTVRLIARF